MRRHYDKPLTAEELAARPDEDIDVSDIPPLDEEFWANAKIVEPRKKSVVSLRLPEDVIAQFKAEAPNGYTSRMAAVLKAYVEARKAH